MPQVFKWLDHASDTIELDWCECSDVDLISLTATQRDSESTVELDQTDAREIAQKLIEMADQFDE